MVSNGTKLPAKWRSIFASAGQFVSTVSYNGKEISLFIQPKDSVKSLEKNNSGNCLILWAVSRNQPSAQKP